MKSYEEIMEILEAYDLTGSFRAAAELAGCSHHTVESYVKRRDAGELAASTERSVRSRLIDPFLPKLEEWVERSRGKIRADVAFDKLELLGFEGSDQRPSARSRSRRRRPPLRGGPSRLRSRRGWFSPPPGPRRLGHRSR